MANERSASTIRLHSVRRLSDRELAVKLGELNVQKHVLDAELLLYLSEIERRRLYREQACSSLFVFCVTRLGQSEDVAYKRVGAARLMLKYPGIYELLANGRIHLSGLILLRPHLDPDNFQELLLAASGKSKRQIEQLIAVRFPQPDVPTTERRLPPSRARRAMAESSISAAIQDAATVVARRVSSASADEISTSAATSPSIDALSVTARRVTSASVDETSTIAARTPSLDESSAARSVTAMSIDESSVTARRVTATSVDESRDVAPRTVSTQTSVTAPSATAPSVNPATPSGTVPSFKLTTPSGTVPSSNPATPSATAPSSSPAARARVEPLSGYSYRVTFTASARLKEKMDRARELLSHAISPSDLPALLERALDQLIEREERRRYGSARLDTSKVKIRTSESPRREAPEHESPRREAPEHESPRRDTSKDERQEQRRRGNSRCEERGPQENQNQHHELHAADELHAACQKHAEMPAEPQDPEPNLGTRAKPRSRYEPAAVRRGVWTRDAGQCTFMDHAGRRCEQRHFLELDHREAFAIGGDATVENLRLRCHAHNALEAEKLFGRDRIERTIAHAKSKRAERAE